MKPGEQLEALFAAERSLRSAEAALLQSPPAELQAVLVRAIDQASTLPDRAEAELRLRRLADLCAQVEGPEMADALIVILNDDNPAVRVEAAEALVDVAYDRYAEVARAVERAVAAGSNGTALRELPRVIAEVAEPSAAPLISRFLAHEDAEIAGSAVEALARLGDPTAISALQKFVDDRREVTVDDGDTELTTTVGELAQEAIETLES